MNDYLQQYEHSSNVRNLHRMAAMIGTTIQNIYNYKINKLSQNINRVTYIVLLAANPGLRALENLDRFFLSHNRSVKKLSAMSIEKQSCIHHCKCKSLEYPALLLCFVFILFFERLQMRVDLFVDFDAFLCDFLKLNNNK